MLGKFMETRDLKQLRSHLMHGRIVYVFTGTSFDLYIYNTSEETGIFKSYSIIEDMKLQSRDCSLPEIINTIKEKLKNKEYHYMLYYGELGMNDNIYDFMKEFYNPKEELPLIVATVLVDDEVIRADISHPCNIQGSVLEQVADFNEKLMNEHINEKLCYEDYGTYSVFSFWLVKNGSSFEVVFRSKYSDIINEDADLNYCRRMITAELNSTVENLGIKVAI